MHGGSINLAALQYRSEIRPELQPDGTVVYLAEYPELPGCMSHGATVEEARQNLEDAKAEYLAALQERGLEIPSPSAAPVVGAVTWVVLTPMAPERAEASLRWPAHPEATAA
jgi:predicted RNase H-like HicB family nuclease